MELIDEIINGESKKIEFKQTLPDKSKIIKTAIAFSNVAGGKILIGIKNNKEILGISDEEVLDLPDRISNIIYDNCYPTIIPEIYIKNIEGKNILVIEIYPGNLKPYYIKSKGKLKGTYIRVGATNKPTDKEMIIELERQKRNVSFDEEILYDYDLNELDLALFMSDCSELIGKEINENDLVNLKLLKEENGIKYATNALILLANQNNYYDYSRIKCAKFKGNNVNEFIDQKEFSGPLYEQIKSAEKFTKMYIAKKGTIQGLQRKDEYEIPIVAIREALINAVVHRDYSISGSDIKLSIFDNRLEIISPGNLPKTLNISDIKEGRSEIRNKIIARFFKEINYIEQWGTGIRRMINACKESDLEEPEFKEPGMFFKVTIIKKSTSEVPVSTDKVTISTDKLNENEFKIIKYFENYNTITNKDVREITGLSDSGAKKVLRNMVGKYLVIAIGENKSRYYILNK